MASSMLLYTDRAAKITVVDSLFVFGTGDDYSYRQKIDIWRIGTRGGIQSKLLCVPDGRQFDCDPTAFIG
jgi:hypothetical protein